MATKVDRGIIEGRKTPEDDVYILTSDGDVVWADDQIDVLVAEKELADNTIEDE